MIETVIYNAFSTDADIISLIGTDDSGRVKVYPYAVDEETTTPAIIYTFDTENTFDDISDEEGMRVLPFSVSVGTGDFMQAATIAKAIKTAGDAIRGNYDDVLVHKCRHSTISRFYDFENKVYIYTVDFETQFENN